MKIRRLEISFAKAEYLLHYTTMAGEGGDKRKFWHDILGFRSPETLRAAILEAVAIDQLEEDGQNAYGDLYRTVITLHDPVALSPNNSYKIRTIWIVHFGKDVASFVTAYPERRKE